MNDTRAKARRAKALRRARSALQQTGKGPGGLQFCDRATISVGAIRVCPGGNASPGQPLSFRVTCPYEQAVCMLSGLL